MDNAADRKSIRRLEKQAQQAAASRAAVVRSIMSTIEGRAWMWSVLSDCHVFGSTFTAGSPDITAFSEGQRAVGLRLLADIMTSCPDAYIEAQREANVRSATDERRSSPEHDRGDHRPVDDYPAEGADDYDTRPLDDYPINRPEEFRTDHH